MTRRELISPCCRFVLSLVWFVMSMEFTIAAENELRHFGLNDTEGSSAAVVVPDVPLGHTAQFLPVDPQGKVIGAGNTAVQIETVLSQVENSFWLGDPTGNPVMVKLHVVAADAAVAAEVRKSLAKRFSGREKPAVTCVVGKRRSPDAVVAMDAVFTLDAKAGARGVLGIDPRRPATVAVLPPGPKVYISGQAEKGKDIAEMTRRTMESLAATMKHLGLGLKDVVQVKSFVGPFEDVGVAEGEIIQFFKDQAPVPPLVWVEWTTAPSIEIELIASAAKAGMGQDDTVEFMTPPGMTASPVFSRVARMAAGPSIYISGLHGMTANDGAAETREIFGQMRGLLDQTGSDFRHLVKATYYVSTSEASTKLNEIRPEFYDPKRPPAASKAPVTGTGRDGRTLTLDMIAVPKSK